MVTTLPSRNPRVFERRRAALASELGDTAALLFSGRPRPRNYPANTHPFRADSHFLYLMGANRPDAVLLIADGKAVLFIPPATVEDTLWHGPVPGDNELASQTGVDAIHPLGSLPAKIAQLGVTRIATLPCADGSTRVLQSDLLARRWPGDGSPCALTQADVRLANAMIGLRLCHDDAALTLIRRAVNATEAAHRAGMAVTCPGLREHDVRAAMEGEFLKRGMACAYQSIITTSGEILHNNVYDNRLHAGDLLLADVGGEYDGWASDVTRTWPVSGKMSASQRDVYDVVLAAQQEAIDRVRPGNRYRDVHLAACLVLATGLSDLGLLRGDPAGLVERGAHALFFPHGIGHLLGMDVHDMEDLGDLAGYAPGRTRSSQFGLNHLRLDRDLEPGMLVTIEPGLYFVPAILDNAPLCQPFDRDGTLVRARLPAFADVRGIRIEDDVLCTKQGPEVLTEAIPKRPGDIEAMVGRRTGENEPVRTGPPSGSQGS